MTRSSLLLTLALSCLLPTAALAKDPAPSRRDKEPKPVMNTQQAQALNKCMSKCQDPMKSCMDDCKGNQDCNMNCGEKFTTCITKTCGDLLPEAKPQE
ncbi:hypothetical protein D187_002398 [Cystobacter fuscus DSM 2262]|uniref:Uncharacterized protein n=1 Tax=Cystobacter fuscus (strain ATCC 25194 / DSM 2262 / NBRC 100088 / M29) TaxID=1242864 RepID=S9QEC1_CYSF2|nr:hypothetical protein [Cystobacter fuscus]EPX59654.1 hypothetical protein D187_002398 [Cystobacter fuscus DSM 2262]